MEKPLVKDVVSPKDRKTKRSAQNLETKSSVLCKTYTESKPLMGRRSFLKGTMNIAGATTKLVASARLLSGITAGGGALAGLSHLAKAADSIQNHSIEIHNLVFVPEVITVCPGDKIRWINRDISPHTATALDGCWDTQELTLNQHRTLIVTEDMAGEYYCLFHPHMRGEIRLK
ncbi:cupredoxin domain-containing protein [Kiloniella litopenaei]|uniref:cupredoxin domain-containing protein n=1 Tax=Kiloniella litopenaei TaxID=1549748 RepID=UPI000697DE61|nr:cupredoxin domain-containing protein [Kiloniella litopenaei]